VARVNVVYSSWTADGVRYEGGEQELALDPELAKLLACAEDAGAVEVLEADDAERALMAGHVQSQEDGEAEYARAQADGRWQEGNLAQYELEQAALAEGRGMVIDVEPVEEASE
jgi:hypothetical protein